MSSRHRLVVVAVLAVSAEHAQADDEVPDGGAEDDEGNGARPAAAAAPRADVEALVAVVRVASEDDAAVLLRIEGQTSDLDVELKIDRAAAPIDRKRASTANDDASTAADITDQLATARALARRHGARVVVWFRRDGDAWIVYVAEPEADRLLIRRIGTDGGQMAGSAAAEAAALVVRTALRALAAGGTIGVDAPDVPAPAPAPAPAAAIVEVAPARPTQSSVRPLRPYGELLWRGVVDGASDLGHHGVAIRLGAAGGPWRVAAAGSYHPAVAHDRDDVTIEVERIDIGAVLGLDLVGRARDREDAGWRIGVDLGLGVARYARTTTDAMDPLTATPPTTTWAATITPGLRLARRLAASTWIELEVGIDFIGNAPEFGVANDRGFAVHTRLWPAEPHAGLGVVVDAF